jgi:hypothetical protein
MLPHSTRSAAKHTFAARKNRSNAVEQISRVRVVSIPAM